MLNMAGLTPDLNDRDFNLWKKISWNFYDFATNRGATGMNAPNLNDPQFILLKKTTYDSAKAVDVYP